MTILVIFVVIALVSFAIVAMATRPTASQRVVVQRLSEMQSSKAAMSSQITKLDLAGLVHSGARGRLERILERYHFTERLNALLLQAGSKSSVSSVVAVSVGTAFACGILTSLFSPSLLVGAIAVVLGALLPYVKLRFQRSRRLKAMNNALPDSIDLMVRSLRAGHSMSSAIEVLAEQSAQPLASEFQQVAQQQRCGLAFRDALMQLAIRVPSKDLHFVVTAILVQKETGGDLTDILDRTVEVIRDRLRIAGEIKTYTAQGRLTGWILGLLPIALLILINIVNPGYSQILFDDPLGHKLLYASGIMITIGGLIIRSIVNIEV